MEKKVSLRAVIEELVALPDDFVAYLDTESGAIFSFSDRDLGLANSENRDLDECPDWQKELILKAREVLSTDTYVALPTGREIDEMRLVRKFCKTLERREVRAELLCQVEGRGAFRRFKEVCRRYGLEQTWYDFEYAETEEIAVDWLESREIPYLRDLPTRETEEA